MFGNLFKKKKKQQHTPDLPLSEQTYRVPACDYELLKYIRVQFSKGNSVIVKSTTCKPLNDPIWQHANAQALKDYYGMTPNEILVETGHWVG